MARVIVIGAGVVGLSAARAAARGGHEVVLIERGPIPNPHQASWDSHRMIRYHYGAAAGYTRMVTEAFAAWDRLWVEIGATHFVDTGAIAIAETEGDYVHRTLAAFREVGLPHRVLDRAETAKLCPQYKLLPQSFGVMAGPGGPLFADRIVRDLARLVETLGVTMMPEAEVVAIDPGTAAATLADGTHIRGDSMIVSTGAWCGGLWPSFAGLPVIRQALCYVEPPATYAGAWNEGPALVAFGDNGGYTLPGVEGTQLKFGYGAHRRPGRPDEEGWAGKPGEEKDILAGFGRFVHDIDQYRPLRLQIGYYTMDATREFHVETEGRTIAVGNCDGQMFKFGPLMGEKLIASVEGRLSATDLKNWAAGR
ncbi:FAD-dependent oxidoreductase [Sphingomonas oligophenolica]|uniref:FAD-dependent oxidoreductase n=1 Tax=Sphingomonas oligophenolica TaxID=301154 RepID=A0ABU9Y549_9SPHN